MVENMREVLAREAEEAEVRADAEDRGEAAPAKGQRPRRPADASQVYSLRLPAEAIAQLRALAQELDEPPTTLLRRFVLERLHEEQGSRHAREHDVVDDVLDELAVVLRHRLEEHLAGVTAKTSATRKGAQAAPAGRRREPLADVNLGPSRRGGDRKLKARAEVSA